MSEFGAKHPVFKPNNATNGVIVGKLVAANLTVNLASGELYADDGLAEKLEEFSSGKIDMGMEFVDINSNDTAFYYGVNQLGCYVLSVQTGSNAEAAGFRRGDLITAVNGQAISSSGDISKALENNKVGDTVTLTVSRSGQTTDLQLTLAEYKPSAKLNSNANSDSGTDNSRRQSTDELWNQLFGW